MPNHTTKILQFQPPQDESASTFVLPPDLHVSFSRYATNFARRLHSESCCHIFARLRLGHIPFPVPVSNFARRKLHFFCQLTAPVSQ